MSEPKDDLNPAVPNVIVRKKESDELEIVFKDVCLDLPQGEDRLVDNFNFTLKQGTSMILTGASGSGKTSIIRAMRDVWRRGTGTITLPADTNFLCLSQKGFFPRLNLRGALSCPKPDGYFTDEQVECALREAGLEKYLKHMPHLRAKPETLYDMGSKFIVSAIKHWKNDIARLADSQLETLNKLIADNVVHSVENFLPPELQCYMTPEKSEELGRRFAAGLAENVATHVERDGYGVNFFDDQKKLAREISQYLLQGMATEQKLSSYDGKTFIRRLSGGEMQRMYFAQALLHKPDILIMDEITASLDAPSGKALYKQILEAIPNAIIISVAHNTHIIDMHTLHAHLEDKHITVTPVRPQPQPI